MPSENKRAKELRRMIIQLRTCDSLSHLMLPVLREVEKKNIRYF